MERGHVVPHLNRHWLFIEPLFKAQRMNFESAESKLEISNSGSKFKSTGWVLKLLNQFGTSFGFLF